MRSGGAARFAGEPGEGVGVGGLVLQPHPAVVPGALGVANPLLERQLATPGLAAPGGVGDLKAAVNDAGVKRFGSGWTWLVWDGTGLAVKSTPNQDSPVMEGQAPILGIDVWEHAYYLNYQNRRPDYLEAWWNVVDWDAVASKFAAARG